MAWFKKKEKDTENIQEIIQKPESTKKKKNNKTNENSETQNVASNKLKIVIFRMIGEDLATQIGKPLIAEEKKDENNNLLAIKEEAHFKEDLNFSIDRVYEVMNFSLGVQGKKNSEKRVILDKKIKEQEEFLIEFENDVELNAKYNYRDEELKLNQLKIFRESLAKEKRGNYMRLGEGGIRQFEFVAIDGILYPYFFGGKRFRVYPDLLVKKKIFNHENTVFRNENADLWKTSLNWMMVILFAVGVILNAVGGALTYHAYTKSSDIDQDINNGAKTCLDTLGTFTQNYGKTLENYMQSEQKKQSDKKKEQDSQNQNNINPDIPIINIDPNNRNN